MKRYSEAYVGQKVRFVGNSTIGKCEGVILKLFPLWPDDCSCYIGYVTVKVNDLPHPWPYSGDDFAPSLNELEVIE